MKPVLLDIEPGPEPLATTASCAAALRLLSRGALGPVSLLAPTRRSRRLLQLSLPVISDRQAPQAIRASSLVVLAGTLANAQALERAARWAVMAKDAGVPVALTAVRLPDVDPQHPALGVLAQCDSVSAGDGRSARHLAALRHDRIECTAPLELLLEPERPVPEPHPFTVGLCGRTLRRGGVRLRQVLQQLVDAGSAQVLVLEVGAPQCRAPSRGLGHLGVRSWDEALHAASRCDLFVAEPDSMWLHMAAAAGAAPVAWLNGSTHSELHDRLGLHELVLSRHTTPGALVAGLERGRDLERPSLRRRVATLRTVAWRSLGILAQAVRSTPLDLERLDGGTRRFVAQVLGTSRAGGNGDGPGAVTAPRDIGARRSTAAAPAATLNLQTELNHRQRPEPGRSPCNSKP